MMVEVVKLGSTAGKMLRGNTGITRKVRSVVLAIPRPLVPWAVTRWARDSRSLNLCHGTLHIGPRYPVLERLPGTPQRLQWRSKTGRRSHTLDRQRPKTLFP